MIRFLLTLARHVDLIGEHALGYAELIRAEISVSLRSWVWRAVAFAVAALFVLIGLLSTALVLTMWSNGTDVASWRAWVVPLASLLVALASLVVALRLRPPPMSAALTEQLQRDLDLLRQARPASPVSAETGDE
jgi:hypothetical protein